MRASKQASTSSDRNESSDSSDEEDIESQVDDAILKEEEKDALRTLGLVDDDCDAETMRVDRDRRRWQRSSFLRLQKQHNCVTEFSISARRQQWRGNVHHARPEFAAETMLRSYISLVFHARPRHFGGPHADPHYAKKTQVWKTSSSWQEEAAENTSELF